MVRPNEEPKSDILTDFFDKLESGSVTNSDVKDLLKHANEHCEDLTKHMKPLVTLCADYGIKNGLTPADMPALLYTVGDFFVQDQLNQLRKKHNL